MANNVSGGAMTRMKLQLTRDRVRLQNQMECLLEEMRIKLSIVVSNLLGASGLRILHALAKGETDANKLAQLGDERLQCTEEQLVDALTGRVHPLHREMLALQLQRLQLIDQQIGELNGLIAQAMKPHKMPCTDWRKCLDWEWIRRNRSSRKWALRPVPFLRRRN
jgi:transposase